MSKQVNLVNSVGISFGCVRMMIGAFSVIYLLRNGLTITEVGWIKSFQAAVIVFVDIPLSHISDKYSRKFSICLSAFCASIWLYLTGTSDHFSGFLVAEFFNALSLGLMSGTFNSYLYDVSKNHNSSDIAQKIFSRYQKNYFFFMGIVSLLGAILYSNDNDNVWFVASVLMFTVFIISLFLPADNDKAVESITTLRDALINARQQIFGSGNIDKSFIYLNITFSLLLQILIQYWQAMMTLETELIDANILFGLVFFAVLMSQALAGVVIEKSTNQVFLRKALTVPVYISGIFTAFSFYYSSLTIPALCLSFFSISAFTSLSLSRLVEDITKEMRSTILSSLAVMSKIVMFLAMPVSALLINMLGIGFNLLVIIIVIFCTRLITPSPILEENND